MKKRALSALLALCMTLTLLPWAAVPARAEVTRRQLMLGASGLIKNNIIYFGNQSEDADHRSWRVLSPAGVNSTLPVSGTDRVLLISSMAREAINFNGTASTAWADSNAQTWCTNFFNGSSFNDLDRAAIAETSVDEDADYRFSYNCNYGAAPLNKEHVFLLSAEEASGMPAGNKQASNGSASVAWWLRSPVANSTTVGMMRQGLSSIWGVNQGQVDTADVYTRPALNLKASSVLFTQVPSKKFGLAADYGVMKAVKTNESNGWKLTLHDSSRDDFQAEVTASNANTRGGTVTIRYENAKIGTNEYVSVLLCDAKKTAVCYGVSAPLTNANQSSGTVTFTVPKLTGLEAKRYKLYVFNEQRNDQKTDAYYPEYYNSYASALQETELPVIGFGSGYSGVQNNTVRYLVQGAPRNALLIAARYDGGKMTDVQTVDLADAEEKADDLTMRGSGTDFTLFLVDKTTFAPLCPAVVRKKSP